MKELVIIFTIIAARTYFAFSVFALINGKRILTFVHFIIALACVGYLLLVLYY